MASRYDPRALALAGCITVGFCCVGCGDRFSSAAEGVGGGGGGGGGSSPDDPCAGLTVGEAPWWESSALFRRPLLLDNRAPVPLGADAKVSVTVDTAALVVAEKLQANCDDLHVIYHPDGGAGVPLPRHLSFAAGAGCSDSSATRLYFPLQAELGTQESTLDYYLYYSNQDAIVAPASSEGAFDVGAAHATMVCLFDGSSTCATGQAPSSERGALRFARSGSAIDFSGESSRIEVAWNAGELVEGTLELFVKLAMPVDDQLGDDLGLLAAVKTGGARGALAVDFEAGSGKLRLTAHDGAKTKPYSSQRASWDAGIWYHLALSWDGAELSFYVDGSFDSSWPVAHPLFADGATMTLGETGAGPFVGAVDEVRVSSAIRYAEDFMIPSSPFLADDRTVLLLHLDESGLDPRLGAAAIDASAQNQHGMVHSAAYVPGVTAMDDARQSFAWRSGAHVESGMSNIIVNPSFELPGKYDGGWSATGALTHTASAAPHLVRHGTASVELVGGAGDGAWVTQVTGRADRNDTLSFFVRGPAGRPISEAQVQLIWADAAMTEADGVVYRYAGGGWWRLSYTATAPATAVGYGVKVFDGVTVYFDGAQYEPLSRPSSYLDGSLGEGYGWDGNCDGDIDDQSPHEGCSVRLGVDDNNSVSHMLEYANVGIVSLEGGAISLWALPDWSTATYGGGNRSLLQAGHGAGWGPGFDFRHDNGGIGIHRFDDLAELMLDPPERDVSVDTSLQRGAWRHAVVTWDGANATVYSNQNANTDLFRYAEETDLLHVGGGAGWTGAADAVIADLRIYDAPLSAAQVQDLFYESVVSPGPQCEEQAP